MYIEFVIADNFLLTYLAGIAAAKLCHKRAELLRTAIAAIAGTVAAVFYPYLRIGFALQIAVKFALGGALSAIMYARTSRPIVSALLFFGCTFAFGGGCYALWLTIGGTGGAAGYIGECPVFLTLTVGAILYVCIDRIVRRLRLARARAPYFYRTEVEIFGQKLNFEGFLDTGNCVFDDRTGLPVAVTTLRAFTDKLDKLASVEFIKCVDRLRTVSVSTAAGETKLYIVRPQKITVYSDKQKHKIDGVLGLAAGDRISGRYELLLGGAAMEGV